MLHQILVKLWSHYFCLKFYLWEDVFANTLDHNFLLKSLLVLYIQVYIKIYAIKEKFPYLILILVQNH